MKQLISSLVILYLTITVGLAQSFQIGHTQQTFYDESRGNRNITTEIYYPSNILGDNVPVATGQFPVVVFGHGFVMVWSAYDVVWEALVPNGYIMVFATTESSFSPSHTDFAKDLAFLVGALKEEGENVTSLFHESVATTSAVMGHSMGGGCSFLAIQYDSTITAVATLAPANTNPSSIVAATNIYIPALVFSGANDCVTPPEDHQIPMYDSLSSFCKTFVSIIGGSHCQFANYNFLCSVGENSCSPDPEITPFEQQSTTFSLLLPWLNFYLKNDCAAGPEFQNLITAGVGINSEQNCTLTCTETSEINEQEGPFLKCSPNPGSYETTVSTSETMNNATLTVYNALGRLVIQMEHIAGRKTAFVRGNLPEGVYFIILSQEQKIIGTNKLVFID